MTTCRTTRVFLAVCVLLMAPAGSAFAGAVCGSTPTGAAATQPAVSPLRHGTDLMLQSADHAETLLPQMAAAADEVAKRWIEGAELFAGGDDAFSDEAFYRAGGLIAMRRIAAHKEKFSGRQMPWDDVPPESIVLYGLLHNVDASMVVFDDLGYLTDPKHTVVFFGSKAWPVSRKIQKILQKHLPPDKVFFIDTQLPVDTRLKTADGTIYGDYTAAATAVHLWAFTAEVVAACTRQGKMPGIWPSAMIPKYEVWEKKYEKIRFHDDFTIKPIAAGVLGGKYLAILREQLKACPASQDAVAAAASRLTAVPPDKSVYVMVDSHLLAGEANLPADLANWLLVQRSWRWRLAAPTLEKGDGILWLGYLHWPQKDLQKAYEQNTVAAICVEGPDEQTASRPNVAWVPAPWKYPDAFVEIADYPLKACPTSGVIQATMFWGLLGEVMQARTPASQPLR